MSESIHRISHLGVNCYLVETAAGFVLIDTGFSSRRERIEGDLEAAGLQAGTLELIIITHGDLDHTGNCAEFRQKYGAPVVMHAGDSGMAEEGDTRYNRHGGSARLAILKVILFLVGASRIETFVPDLYVDEGFDLSVYGLDARIIHIPGHTRGSIGVLAAAGDFFCGDLLMNNRRPVRGPLIDDPADYAASIRRLQGMKIGTVYPGHGRPFRWAEWDHAR